MTTDRIPCTLCSRLILPATAAANHGLCAQCIKLSPSQRETATLVKAQPNPIAHAIKLYDTLIDNLVATSPYHHFGGIADPQFEAVRFYTLPSLHQPLDYDTAIELGAEQVDTIEPYLLANPSPPSLFLPILKKLRSIAPQLNATGHTIFLGSWGMGPAEIGWLIRHLNDRPTFERYLHEASITEDSVNAYNAAYSLEVTEAE